MQLLLLTIEPKCEPSYQWFKARASCICWSCSANSHTVTVWYSAKTEWSPGGTAGQTGCSGATDWLTTSGRTLSRCCLHRSLSHPRSRRSALLCSDSSWDLVCWRRFPTPPALCAKRIYQRDFLEQEGCSNANGENKCTLCCLGLIFAAKCWTSS